MSAAEKGFYYRRVKSTGAEMTKHYREYTTDELKEADARAQELGLIEAPTEQELAELDAKVHAPKAKAPELPTPQAGPEPDPEIDADAAAFFGFGEQATEQTPHEAPAPARPAMGEMAGERLNTKDAEEILFVDDEGRAWLQKEVLKPAFPKPRGRRVLRYNNPGVKQQTSKDGDYTETFEVAGDPRNATPAEIKITLPSYQVGIYRSKKFPFKVITYNGKSAFDRQEVEAYYGGAEMVPPVCKRVYVENVLCYDMRSVIRAIQDEFRQLRLTGRV